MGVLHDLDKSKTTSAYKSALQKKIDVLGEQIDSLLQDIEVQKKKIAEYYWSIYERDGSCDNNLLTEFKTIRESLDKIYDLDLEIQIIIDGNNQLLQQPVQISDVFLNQYGDKPQEQNNDSQIPQSTEE
ncbi:MAG: hypothetical protein LBQ58_02295 [Synergistaceae bacterium]|jgi:hypothetical protein|nr:hypothetical protein [Synergistaceae bacterium]